jgi:hypothetical protein
VRNQLIPITMRGLGGRKQSLLDLIHAVRLKAVGGRL